MKKVVFIFLFATSVIGVAFVSKQSPSTFEEDAQDLMTLVDAKTIELSEATTYQDSVNIANEVKAEADEMLITWDVQAEYEARMPGMPCWFQCIVNFLFCIDRGSSSTLDCLIILIKCEQGCFVL